MKKIIALVFAMILTVLVCACSSGSDTTSGTSASSNEKSYKNDVTCELLSKNAEQVVKLDNIEFKEIGRITAKALTGIKEIVSDQLASDYVLKYTGGKSCDEFGVFHFKDQDGASRGAELIKTYLKSKADDTANRSYYGEEAYKFDESEVRTFGNYVAYAILTKANRTAFFNQIEQLLAA